MQELSSLQQSRQNLTKRARQQIREKEALKSRKQNFNLIYPLKSQTLEQFHCILSYELDLQQQKIYETIINEDLYQLDQIDYDELLIDILFLVSEKDFKFPHIEFRRDYVGCLPEIISCFFANFHPQTVAESFQLMGQLDREVLYSQVVDNDKLLPYIKVEIVKWALKDIEQDSALNFIKYCLKIGKEAKEIISHGTKKIFAIFKEYKVLKVTHFEIAYFIIIRSKDQFYVEFLKELIVQNASKVVCQTEYEFKVFRTIVEKVKNTMIEDALKELKH